MAKKVLTITNALVRLHEGDTEPPNWNTLPASFACQVTEASITSTPVTVTVPATFCEGETETVGKSRWTVNLSGLQDWTDANGLSQFLFDEETKPGWVQISMPTNTAGDSVAVATAKVRFVAGDFGGPANDPLLFSVSMPCQAKPTITQATVAGP